MNIKYIYKKYTPEIIVQARAESQNRKRFTHLHNKILEYLKSKLSDNSISIEEKTILNYLQSHFLSVFPYSFADKYNYKDVDVIRDRKHDMYYVIWNGKKLYFKNDMAPIDIKRAVCALMQEQDNASPHRYLTNDFYVQDDSVIIDVGAAEGNFSLDHIEKARKIYVIEADPKWKRALELTFAPWKEKVEIIYKFASDVSDENSITINDIYKKEGKVDFIKIDVEGAEEKVINGASDRIKNNQSKLHLVVCTYHRQDDAERLQTLLNKLGFNTKFSDGYMFFIYDKHQEAPYMRKGLLRAVK